MAESLVSIILVNWNRADDIIDTLTYLQKVHYENYEIIVVDNGSTDDSIDRLRGQSGIRLVELGMNCGPAKGRNAGAKVANGPYLFFLDSDAFLANNALNRLVERMEEDSGIGIIGCRVINFFSKAIDQWIYHQSYKTHGEKEFDTYSFSAAGAIVRTSVFKLVGGFWEDLFIYNEEVDLSIRVIREGSRVIYSPDANVYHRVSPHGRAPDKSYFYYQIRNWIWIFYRYYPAIVCLKKVGIYSAVYVVKGTLNRRLWPCLQGICAGLRGLKITTVYGPKLSMDQVQLLEQLNQRTKLRIGR